VDTRERERREPSAGGAQTRAALGRHPATMAALTIGGWLGALPARADVLEAHRAVRGTEISVTEVRAEGGTWKSTRWEDLEHQRVPPGRYELRLQVQSSAAAAVEIPVCAGEPTVRLDGHEVGGPPGPVVVPLSAGRHDLSIGLHVSAYERRIACGASPRTGEVIRTVEGLGVLAFASPHASTGGGTAVVFLPQGHDARRPAHLLVGTHPWNGSMWTYAAYAELLREAQARDVVLLLPSGLGNSLYTADAEDEVMRAIGALSTAISIDPRGVSIWGASMGGAGALTIGFHHPDRFATITSFFGDSKYDRSTYVRVILRDDAAAHRVNALDVIDNARHVPVWLVHGEEDRTCPIAQSEALASALAARGLPVRFDRVPDAGHEGALVARFLPEVVDMAASALVPAEVTRVTYRSVRPEDVGAYGVTFRRIAATGDAFVDVEQRDGTVHVRDARGVAAIRLSRGALGTDRERPPAIVVDDGRAGVDAGWEPPP
jgi:enterochelin esterase-like enzyme